MMTNDHRKTEAHALAPWQVPVPRRRFLTLAALGAVGVTCPTTSEAATAIPVQTLTSPGLLSMLGSERAVHLGERYRQLVPAEDDAQVLIQAILMPSQRIVSPNLATELAEQVRQDFTDGRTVAVHGWILAVTEARQCALYSLHVS